MKRQIDWMRETRLAVVVSEEQGEVKKFQQVGSGHYPAPEAHQGRHGPARVDA